MDSSSTPLANPTAAPNLPMHFGIPFDNPVSFVLFLVCLVSGMCLVYLFCEKKFAERSSTETVDYVDQLLPPHLATREEYTKGFLIYFGLMATSVLVLSLIGPRGLALLGISAAKDIDQAFVPIVVAFLLVGLLGNVPGLLAIENRLRTFAHERAYIPAAARAIAQRLATADFNFSAYGGDVLQEPEMRGVEPADFTRSRCTLEHDWARLACLVYEQKSRRMVGRMDGLDANLLRDYGKDLDAIENAKKSMEPDVALYREKRRNDKFYTDDALRRAIRDNLYKLYILLGCAVRLNQQPHSDIERELNQFGFRVDRVTPPLGKGNGDLNLVGLSIAAVSVLMLGFAGTELGLLGLWTPTFAFPKEHYQPFVDLVSTLIPHVLAIMMADIVRRRAIRKGRWFQRGTHAANYVRVAFVCGLAGYIGLVLWGFAQVEKITAVGLRIDAPYALLAMATGGFYAYHLDNVEKNRRPSRLWEVGSQAIVTGLCGLVAATVSFDLILGQPLMAIDRIILTAVYGAAVGLVLGWYIPKAAAAKFDPLADSKDERVRTLEIRALAQFGNSTAATNWLDKPNPLLGQKSPRVAAADVDGFERAVTILQGPQELAV